MTKICFVLSVSFLLLTFPMIALRLAILMGMVDGKNETMVTVSYLFDLLAMSNHVINFWVYFVFWREFRRRALKIFVK